MYKQSDKHQITFFDFNQSCGIQLDTDNEWVRLADRLDWAAMERKYAALFPSHTGHPAKPLRMALGALIIQKRLGLSDRGLVRAVAADPHLQYFLGVTTLQPKCPFGASSLGAFRDRLQAQLLLEANALCFPGIHSHGTTARRTSGKTQTPPPNYVQLHEAREKLEELIDILHKEYHPWKKPRTYRRVAREEYRTFMRSKKRTPEKVRALIHKQLGYIRRDLHHLDAYMAAGCSLPAQYALPLQTVTALYEQQKYLLETHTQPTEVRIICVDTQGYATLETAVFAPCDVDILARDAWKRHTAASVKVEPLSENTGVSTGIHAGGESFFDLPEHFTGAALIQTRLDEAAMASLALSLLVTNLFATPREQPFWVYYCPCPDPGRSPECRYYFDLTEAGPEARTAP